MKLEFLDMEERSNPLNHSKIDETDSLIQLLNRLRQREPFLCQLTGDNGYQLTLGLGGMIGSVQHSKTDGQPPYLMAVSKDFKDGNKPKFVEFLAAHTPTPVPSRYCIDFDLLKQVAVYFLETGHRSSAVSWEELSPSAYGKA